MVSGLGGVLGALGGSTIGASVVSLILDTKRFDAGLVSAKGRLVQATGQMEAGVSKLGFVAKAGLAAVALGFLKVATDGVKASIEAREAQLKLANSIENSERVTRSAIPAFNEQADALRRLTGVDDEAVTGAQAFLIQMKATQDQVLELTPLIVDLAAKLNIDLTSATKAVGRAINGNTAGLGRLGIVVDKTRAESDAYAATLEALAGAQGFAARRADDQPWRRLGASWEELTEVVGEELVPVLVDFTDWMADVIENAGPVVEAIGDIVGGLSDLLSLRIPGSDDWIDTWNKLRDAVASGAVTAEEAHRIIDRMADAGFPGVTERAAEFHQEIGEVTHGLQLSQLAAAGYSGSLADLNPNLERSGDAARDAGRGMRRFAGLTKEGLEEFKESARESLNFAAARFEDLEDRADLTARGILRALRRANRDQQHFAQNAHTFLRNVHQDFGPGMERAAEQMVAALAEAGPEGARRLDVLAGANDRVVRGILREWRTSEDRAENLASKITTIGDAIDGLPTHKTFTFTLDILQNVHGGPISAEVIDQVVAELRRRGIRGDG